MIKLYKYTSFNTAIKIIKNRKFRFSSPKSFNDPFDTNNLIIYGLPVEDFARKYIEEHPKIIEELKHSLSSIPSDVTEFNEHIIKISKLGGVEQLIHEIINYKTYGLKDAEKYFKNSMKPKCNKFGIFCASEVYNETLMWAHYADSHRGVVFEILPSNNSHFSKYKPVIYSDDRPAIFKTPEIMIKRTCQSKQKTISEVIFDVVYSKQKKWEYEKELRIALPNLTSEDNQHKNVKFHPNEISALYLGCNMGVDSRNTIIPLAKELNSNIHIFQSTLGESSYDLEFQQIL